MDKDQLAAFAILDKALHQATHCDLFAVMATHVHPDVINNFCDAFAEFKTTMAAS